MHGFLGLPMCECVGVPECSQSGTLDMCVRLRVSLDVQDSITIRWPVQQQAFPSLAFTEQTKGENRKEVQRYGGCASCLTLCMCKKPSGVCDQEVVSLSIALSF